MEVSSDDLAGIVDLFGALTRAELAAGLAEVAFKRGEDHDPERFDPAIEDALRTYHLVAVPRDAVDELPAGAESALLPGPVAYPALPEGATDLPHILDVEERTVDRAAAGRAAEEQFRADAATAIADGDDERIAGLLDVSYELDLWAPVSLPEARDRLDAARE